MKDWMTFMFMVGTIGMFVKVTVKFSDLYEHIESLHGKIQLLSKFVDTIIERIDKEKENRGDK